MDVLVFVFALFVYFIPTIVGYDKKNVGGIFALNLFMGWTVIGWVAALVWACTKDDKPIEVTIVDPLDKIKKLKELLNSGAIDQAEYDKQKKKILGE